jgi:DNA-binding transcriptional regulator GbsR (MarR family)
MADSDQETTPTLPASVAEAIEAFSLVFEQFGFPRMGGRIFAYLILSDQPHVTKVSHD